MSDERERVMVDIETLGTMPGCVILSVGACYFEPGNGVVGERFYTEIDKQSCREAGLTVDEETEAWWESQDDDLVPLDGDTSLSVALDDLRHFAFRADEVWANGPAFDCAILEAAYHAVDIEPPWEYHEERDVRTIRALPGAVELEFGGRKHNALDDAVHQASEVAATLDQLDQRQEVAVDE
jgi:hypothetical protein